MERSPLTCTSEELYGILARANRTWLMLSLSNPAITEDHVIAGLRSSAMT